jgi:hypothetical protein
MRLTGAGSNSLRVSQVREARSQQAADGVGLLLAHRQTSRRRSSTGCEGMRGRTSGLNR